MPNTDHHPPSGSNVSPASTNNQIFGRERELAQLTEVLDQSLESTTQLALLVGEPGIGKTRLAEEFGNMANNRGILTAWGSCLDGSGAPPYWPWIQILESLDRQIDGGLDSLNSSSLSHLYHLLPEIFDKTPDRPEEPDRPTRGTEDEEFVIGRAIRDVLTRASNHKPLLLVIEDIHWSDDASLATLNLLANSLRDLPLLMVATYRDTDVSRTRSLAAVLPSLTRSTTTVRIPVRGLNQVDTGSMLVDLAAGSVHAINTEDVAERTGGNPFFIREIAAAIETNGNNDARDTVPEGIREAIGRRLSDLDSSSLEILQIGSLIGRSFDAIAVSEIAGQGSADEIAEACESLIALGILTESGSDLFTYTFAHSLFQETVTSEISTSRRIRTHARIAETLEKKHGVANPIYISEIATHYIEAELLLGPDTAIDFALAAGENALANRALDTAAQFADRGLEIARAANHPKVGELLLLRAHSVPLSTSYSQEERWNTVETSFNHFKNLGDDEHAIESALIGVPFGGVEGPARMTGDALKLIQDDDPRKPWLTLRYGIALDNDLARGDDAIELFKKVKAEAEIAGDVQLVTRANAHLCQTTLYFGDFVNSVGYGKRAIALGHQHGDWASAGRAPDFLAVAMVALGDAKGVIGEVSGLEHLFEIPIYLVILNRTRAYAELVQGNWSAATASYIEWMKVGHQPGMHPESWAIIGALRGDKADWIDRFKEESPNFVINIGGGIKWLGQYASAAVIAAKITGDMTLLEVTRAGTRKFDSYHPANHPRWDIYRIGIDALVADIENDRESASKLLPRLQKLEHRFEPLSATAIDRLEALLHTTLGNNQAARQSFENALVCCEKVGYWPEFVRASLDFAGLLKTTGNYSKGQEIAASGLAQSTRLDMDLYTDKLTELKQHFTSTTAPAIGVLPDGLSEREVEVIQLVAAGNSNQEIADLLFISRYTVVRHISNIFGKIGTSNRAEATTYAHQHNLIEP